MNKKNNKKAAFTKKQIANTLIKLLDEFSYDEITILQICQYGDVSRASFYRNFSSKDEVMSFYIKDIIDKKIPDIDSNKRMFFNSDDSLDVWFNEKDLLYKLYVNDIFYIFTKQLIETINNSFRNKNYKDNDPYYDYLSSEMAYIISSIFYKWTQRNFKENRNELSELLKRLHLSRAKKELLPKEKAGN